MSDETIIQGSGGSGVSRRTVMKGAAWSVPVVMVAAAAPAFALSGQEPQFTPGEACKAPGNSCNPFVKGYVFPYTIYNPDPVKTIYICAVTITGSDLSFALATPSLPIAVPPLSSVLANFNASSNNSANQVFTATLTFTWGHLANCTDSDHDAIVKTVDITGTPPDCCR